MSQKRKGKIGKRIEKKTNIEIFFGLIAFGYMPINVVPGHGIHWTLNGFAWKGRSGVLYLGRLIYVLSGVFLAPFDAVPRED